MVLGFFFPSASEKGLCTTVIGEERDAKHKDWIWSFLLEVVRLCLLEEAQKKAEAVFFWKVEHLSSSESTKGTGEARPLTNTGKSILGAL